MQVVFTIGSGEGADHELVEKFLQEANDDLGWLDIRSHPLGLPSDAIRVTMYNHQTMETVKVVREFMHEFRRGMCEIFRTGSRTRLRDRSQFSSFPTLSRIASCDWASVGGRVQSPEVSARHLPVAESGRLEDQRSHAAMGLELCWSLSCWHFGRSCAERFW